MESRGEMGWRQLQRVGTLRDLKVEKSVSLWCVLICVCCLWKTGNQL